MGRRLPDVRPFPSFVFRISFANPTYLAFNGANLHIDNCGQNTGSAPITGWIVEGNTFKAKGSPNNQCLDIQVLERGHGLQTFECAEGDAKQIWTY